MSDRGHGAGAAARDRRARRHGERPRRGPVSAPVGPELGGEPGSEQHQHEVRPSEHVSTKPATAMIANGTSVMKAPPSRTSARATSAPTAAVRP